MKLLVSGELMNVVKHDSAKVLQRLLTCVGLKYCDNIAGNLMVGFQLQNWLIELNYGFEF